MEHPYRYFDRDISWLFFNEHVLAEASDESVPLVERIRILSIFSSNLDEFYRVRMPFLRNKSQTYDGKQTYLEAERIIEAQQNTFGHILSNSILPQLKKINYNLHYGEAIPAYAQSFVIKYFYTHVAGLLHLVRLNKKMSFSPENNQIYLLVLIDSAKDKEKLFLVNVPTQYLQRFIESTW